MSVKAVIPTSGGMGNLYLHTLNTAGISGSKEKKAAAATTGKIHRIQMTPIICTASVLVLKRK
nr:hypothetical protein [Enterocloster bolteae]